MSPVQSLSQVRLFATPWSVACQASLSITNSFNLLKLMSTELVMTSNCLILYHSLLLLPSIFPSIRVFPVSQSVSSGSQRIGVSASGSVLLMNIQDGLLGSPCSPRDSQESSPISSSKTSIIQRSAFFIIQLSHPYMTTGKTIALTRWTFVGKVTSLLFNMLSRLVIAFLPRSKCLLISWLQSSSAVILEPPKNKVSVSIVSPSIAMK